MQTKQSHSIDSLFALILFCIFALTAVISAVMGANVYISSSKQWEKRYENRVCLDYITAKIHSAGEKGAVSVMETEGQKVLVLSESVENEIYDTYIYCLDGSLCELYCARGIPLSLDSGTEIARAERVDFDLDGSLLTVSCTDPDGRTEKVFAEVLL